MLPASAYVMHEISLAVPQSFILLFLQVRHLNSQLVHDFGYLGEHIWLGLGWLKRWKLRRKLVLGGERQLLRHQRCSLLVGHLQKSQ